MRKQMKKAINLANISYKGKPQAGDMLVSSFLPSTGGQGSEQRQFSVTVKQRGRILWGKPFCMIIIKKQQKGNQRNSSNMELELASFLQQF